jgi:hypothetical protein
LGQLIHDIDAAALQGDEGEIGAQRHRSERLLVDDVAGIGQDEGRMGDRRQPRAMIIAEGGAVLEGPGQMGAIRLNDGGGLLAPGRVLSQRRSFFGRQGNRPVQDQLADALGKAQRQLRRHQRPGVVAQHIRLVEL